MTKQEFDTMNFHNGMKYAYTDIITKGIETLNLVGVSFDSELLYFEDNISKHYSEVELIEEPKWKKQ